MCEWMYEILERRPAMGEESLKEKSMAEELKAWKSEIRLILIPALPLIIPSVKWEKIIVSSHRGSGRGLNKIIPVIYLEPCLAHGKNSFSFFFLTFTIPTSV